MQKRGHFPPNPWEINFASMLHLMPIPGNLTDWYRTVSWLQNNTKVISNRNFGKRTSKDGKIKSTTPTLKGMSRCVPKKETAHTSVDIHDNVCSANSPGKAAHMIHKCWDQLWATQQIDVPSVAQKLVPDYGLIPPKQSWKLTLKDVWMVVETGMVLQARRHWRLGRRSGIFPTKPLLPFINLPNIGKPLGLSPANYKQVNIPKSHKIGSYHICKIENLRPIAVLNNWWCMYASAWTQGEQVRG